MWSRFLSLLNVTLKVGESGDSCKRKEKLWHFHHLDILCVELPAQLSVQIHSSYSPEGGQKGMKRKFRPRASVSLPSSCPPSQLG